MRPASSALRVRSQPACQLCTYILQQPVRRRAFLAAPTLKAPSIRRNAVLPRIPTRGVATTTTTQDLQPTAADERQSSSRTAALRSKLARIEKHISSIKNSQKVESEAATIEALDDLASIARQAIAIRSRKPPAPKINIRQSSAGAILSLGGDENEDGAVRTSSPRPSSTNELPSPTYISRLAQDLLRHPNVFISPNVLAVYVHLQRLIGCPRAIPEIFYLYANKPTPELGSSPPKFSSPSPKAAKQAIPASIAEEALTAAIEAKDLPLALDVVQMSYCAPAWRRHRMLAKLGVPGAIAAVTPLVLYLIAQELSIYSNYIDPALFKLYSFLGLSTYVLCTGTLGFVALTTYNDNHIRVVWRQGMPLLDRYLREGERAALDRIACAWGFKEDWRRGDEEGEDWEGLRQYILLRGMILDKSDLMPGMNP